MMRRQRFLQTAFAVMAVALALITTPHATAASLKFGLFGDVYMSGEHEGYLKGMLDDMARKNNALAIFTGGLKPTDQSCQDNHLLAAFPVLANAPLPTIYIPGDAEWVLCAKFLPEDRLNLLRKNYYANDLSLGMPGLVLIRQPAYPELMRWQHDSALFVSLNVTGDNNHWGNKAESSLEFQQRNRANLDWLREAFEAARTSSNHVLVIIMHGDPEFDNPGISESPKGYRPLLDLLKSETEAFPGQVLLVHGGNGVHRIDHPLLDDNGLPLQNFTRVGTYGALQQGWVEVRVEKNSKADNDPVNRTEFRFESFPWPPLSHDDPSDPTDAETATGALAPVTSPIQ